MKLADPEGKGVSSAPAAKKTVFRVGDKVRIVRPIFVERVGYPLTWSMLRDEVQANPLVEKCARQLGITWGGKAQMDFERGICQALVRTRKFGGSERSIHTYEKPHALGKRGTVSGKRTVMTGTYFPPSGGRCSWDGEYEFNPGGLDNPKAHILLLTEWGEIESCHVQRKVEHGLDPKV